MTAALSALDETFLEIEDGDPGAHMHLGAILVLGPSTDGPTAPEEIADRIRQLVRTRIDRFPRLAQRLSASPVARVRRRHWVADDAFDLDLHLRRAALPSPGDRAALESWCGEFFGQRLDRRHPLWEIVVLEGLADGRWALATKLHHCLADGIGSLGIAETLFTANGGPDLTGSVPKRGPERPSLVRAARAPLGLAKDGCGTLRHPTRIGGTVRSIVAGGRLLADELLHRPVPALAVPLGRQRRFATVTVPMRDVRTIERVLGGTINDVVLAVVAGALRHLLLHRGDEPSDRGVRAMVPVDRRDPGTSTTGNRISALFVDLPVAVQTVGARHVAVHAAAAARKHAGQAGGSSAVLRLAELVPPAMHGPLARLFVTPRLFDLTVTNVVGPPQPLRIVDCPVREIHPLVPLAPDHALGVAVISHADAMTFGVVADFDAVPDLDVFVSAIRTEHAALVQLSAHRVPAAPASSAVSPSEAHRQAGASSCPPPP